MKFRAKYMYQIRIDLRLRYLITRLTIKSLGISMRMMRAHSLYIFMAPSMPEWKDLRVLVAFASFFPTLNMKEYNNFIFSGYHLTYFSSFIPAPPSLSRCAAIFPSNWRECVRFFADDDLITPIILMIRAHLSMRYKQISQTIVYITSDTKLLSTEEEKKEKETKTKKKWSRIKWPKEKSEKRKH